MKIRITLLAAACGVALAACGGDTPAPAEPVATTPVTEAPAADVPAVEAAAVTPPAEAPATGPAAVVADCSTTIESNDAMQFNAASIAVPSSCTDFTIKLVHTGQMPVAAMGHNVVIAAQADMAGVLADGMGAGLDNNYVKPGDTRVVAHTEVIGGGGSTSVTFPVSKLQAGGPFEFFCSFPGHAALMKGTISVE